LFAAIVGAAVCTGAAPARAHDDLARATMTSRDLSGDYDGTRGATTLVQQGVHVSGAYAYHHGQIDGVVVGTTVRFSWIQDDGSGRGEFFVRDDGLLIGTWGMGYDDHNGGAWSLAPAGAGTADVVASTRAGSLQLGIRYTWDVQSLPDGVVMGVGGIGLTGGFRVTDRIYLGAVGESESITRTTGDGAPDYVTLRVGGEARYYLHDGVASSTPDEASWGPVSRHDWIGVRYGMETYDWGATFGSFADATLGTDIELGTVGLGFYLTAGLSRQLSSAFDQPLPGPVTVTFATGLGPYDTQADATMTTSPYVGFGMSLLID
jgi:hypothetical protein